MTKPICAHCGESFTLRKDRKSTYCRDSRCATDRKRLAMKRYRLKEYVPRSRKHNAFKGLFGGRITVIDCPFDEEVDIKMFPPGAIFNFYEFVADHGQWPAGMIIRNNRKNWQIVGEGVEQKISEVIL